MTLDQYLLTQFAEECMEIAHVAMKASRFGIDETQPGLEPNSGEPFKSNKGRIVAELNDLVAVVDMLQDRDLLPGATLYNDAAIRAKKDKVLRYMDYSRQQGMLTE